MINLIKVFTFLVCLVTFSQQDNKFTKTQNIFEEYVNITSGSIMQCEITKTGIFKPQNSIHVFSHITGYRYGSYTFFPVAQGTKCYSFDVRTKCYPHFALSDLPGTQNPLTPTWMEVILQYSEELGPKSISVIRKNYDKIYAKASTPNIVNQNEYRGFWIRWSDDHLVEVGRKSENVPFMSYRSPTKLSINYIGINSFITKSDWILHGDANCPKPNGFKDKIETESNCFILS